jgi:hypothetical protein
MTVQKALQYQRGLVKRLCFVASSTHDISLLNCSCRPFTYSFIFVTSFFRIIYIYKSESTFVGMCNSCMCVCRFIFFEVPSMAVINKIKYISCCWAADNSEVVFSFGSVLGLYKGGRLQFHGSLKNIKLLLQ